MKSFWNTATAALRIEFSRVSHTEKLVSIAGGFTGILFVLLSSSYFVGAEGASLIVASMGASAVLLFAVPHGALSQPWPVLGGHLLSAFIGVTCAKWVPNSYIAAALAASLAIGAMHYLKCLHPPGGATALTAVLGGAGIQSLGYQFVITPVLMNVTLILSMAVLFNFLFPWRQYPASLSRRSAPRAPMSAEPSVGTSNISHADLVYALSEIDSFIDVTESDLLRIYDLAIERSQRTHLNEEQVKLGHYYSNGKYGDEWAVRQVVDVAARAGSDENTITFNVIAGAGRRSRSTCTPAQFARWAKYEVVRNENSWQRTGPTVYHAMTDSGIEDNRPT
jgi:CBS-domain-containing membrane protein